MHVAVLLNTSIASGEPDENFRSAVLTLVERLAATNHVAVYSFGDRAARAAGFTQDAVALRSATTGIFGWAHQRSHLIDAIDMALRDLERTESTRPVIVALCSETRRRADGRPVQSSSGSSNNPSRSMPSRSSTLDRVQGRAPWPAGGLPRIGSRPPAGS
jgi:hypothetical protein